VNCLFCCEVCVFSYVLREWLMSSGEWRRDYGDSQMRQLWSQHGSLCHITYCISAVKCMSRQLALFADLQA